MKDLIKIFLTTLLISFLATSALAQQKCNKMNNHHMPYVACDTEISWEQGRRTPSGAALRLLRIAESHPEHLLQH